MFINLSGETANRVITTVKGTAVIEYSHVKNRHNERIKRVFHKTGLHGLRYAGMIKKAIETINRKYEEIVTTDGAVKQQIIYYPIPIKVNGVVFVYEIATFITSSRVKFDYNNPRKVANEYVEAYDKGILVINRPCICIETVINTVRLDSERRKAYTKYDVIETVELTNEAIEMELNEFKGLVGPLISNNSKMTAGVKYMMKRI